jgi:hypothetical protein
MSVPPREPKRSTAMPLLMGCGVVVGMIMLCGGLVAFFGVRGFRAGLEQLHQDEQLAEDWSPPAADATVATFAPQEVASYRLTASDDEASFPALGLRQEGSRAIYERDSERIEVLVYRMSEAEAAAALDEVVRRIDDGDRFRSRWHVRLPRSLRFHINPPELHGVFWYAGGWLIFLRSETVSDLDPFLRDYLKAVELKAVEGTPPDDVETT